jgi:hypothetical protein
MPQCFPGNLQGLPSWTPSTGVKRSGQADGTTLQSATYRGDHFAAEVIRHAVWLYRLFGLSQCDVGLILTERSVIVTHESIRR